MKRTGTILFVVFILLVFSWGILSPAALRGAFANNIWSIAFLNDYFNPEPDLARLTPPPPTFAHSYIFLARDAMRQGNMTEALRYISQVDESPHPLTSDNYASLLYQNERYDEALDIWIKIGDDVTLEKAASDFSDKGLPELSIKALRGLYDINPEKYVSSLALTLKSVERFDEALDLFSSALSTYVQSENRVAWYRYSADIYLRQGNYSEAESTYKLASQENPSDAKTWRNMGLMYLGQLKNPQKAADCFQMLIDINPQDTYGYTLLAQSYEAMGQVDQAVETYKQALAIDPNQPSVKEALQRLMNP